MGSRFLHLHNFKSFIVFILLFATLLMYGKRGQSQEVFTTIPVGVSPVGVWVDTETNLVFVANFGLGSGNTVSVIDGETFQVIKTIEVGKGPGGVTVNSETNLVYVTNTGLDPFSEDRLIAGTGETVSVIDGLSLEVIETVTVEKGPAGIAVNEETNLIYVANAFGNSISVIDGDTNNVISTIGRANFPIEVRVDEETNTVYSSNSRLALADGSLGIFRPDANFGNRQDTVGAGLGAAGLGFNPETNRIYVANFRDNNVSVITGGDRPQLSKIIAVGSRPGEIGVNPSTNHIFVANSGDNTVTVIDGESDTVIGVIGVGSTPAGIGVDPENDVIYVSNVESNNVTVIFDGTGPIPTVTTTETGPATPTPTPTPIPELELSSLTVTPTSANGVNCPRRSDGVTSEAIVTALDQNNDPIPNVNINAFIFFPPENLDRNEIVPNVTPANKLTDNNGTAVFDYQFCDNVEGAVITFSAGSLSVTLTQN